MAVSTEQLPNLAFAGQFSLDDLLLIRDVSQNQDFKLKLDTLLTTLVENKGNIQSIQADIISNRPAAGTADRWFIATDEPALYQDDGNNWLKIQGTASGFDEGSGSSEIPTNATRDGRANTFTAMNTFNAGVKIVNISSNGNTIKSLNTDGNITLQPDGNGVVKTDVINENSSNVGVTVENVLIKNGNVDGVDVSALETDVNGFPDALKNLTTAEINQLENINSVTISNTQWGYLGAMDQGVSTTDNVTFNQLSTDIINENTGGAGVTIDTVLIKDGNVDGVDVSALKNDVDGFPDALKNITTGEINQLQNIDSVTISNAQWGHVGAMDQDVATTSSVTFNSVDSKLVDGSGNDILTRTASGTPVNNLDIENADTGDPVVTKPVGSDSNISRNEKTKGSGTWTINSSHGVDRIINSGGSTATRELVTREYVDNNSGSDKFILVKQLNFSNVVLVDFEDFGDNYDLYKFEIIRLGTNTPSSSNYLYSRIKLDGNSSYSTSSYASTTWAFGNDGTSNNIADSSLIRLTLNETSNQIATSAPLLGTMWVAQPSNTTYQPYIRFDTGYMTGAPVTKRVIGHCRLKSTKKMIGLRFAASPQGSNDIFGLINVYGITS